MIRQGEHSIIDYVVTTVVGIAGFALILPFLWDKAGIVGIGAGLLLFPLSFPLVPLWIFLETGYVVPLLVCWGGAFLVVKGRRIWGGWM